MQSWAVYVSTSKEVGDLSETAVASFRFEMGPDEEEEGIPSLGSSAHPDKCTEPEAKSRFLLFGGSVAQGVLDSLPLS